jgi:hypothetical protein
MARKRPRHVQYAAVLDVAACADADVVHVAADHGHRPDRDVVAQFDVADHERGRIDVGVRAEPRMSIEIRAYGHRERRYDGS